MKNPRNKYFILVLPDILVIKYVLLILSMITVEIFIRWTYDALIKQSALYTDNEIRVYILHDLNV